MESHATILVVDDDAPTRMLLNAGISQWGYKTLEASDGFRAWEILQQPDPPRLVILDWVMPGMDGISLCQKIRKEQAGNPYTYVILLTQLSGTDNANKGLEAGVDDLLSKPFNMAELHSRLLIGMKIVNYENELHKLKNDFEVLKRNISLVSQKISQFENIRETKISEIEKELKKITSLVENGREIKKDAKEATKKTPA